MTYKELKAKYPSKEFGNVHVTRISKSSPKCYNEWDTASQKYLPPSCSCPKDEKGEHLVDRPIEDLGWQIQLPHSCDEWVIGGIEDAEKMIGCLKQAVEYCKANP